MPIPIEWDTIKNETNLAKHGVALSHAVQLDWLGGLTIPDARVDYGEVRFVQLGAINGRLHIAAFTLREGKLRIISLRRANSREIRRYEHHIASNPD